MRFSESSFHVGIPIARGCCGFSFSVTTSSYNLTRSPWKIPFRNLSQNRIGVETSAFRFSNDAAIIVNLSRARSMTTAIISSNSRGQCSGCNNGVVEQHGCYNAQESPVGVQDRYP